MKDNKHNKCTQATMNNNKQTNSGNWTIKNCKDFLDKLGAPKGGIVNVLWDYCVLILKLEKMRLSST